MRLLDVEVSLSARGLNLIEKFGRDIPSYAIISHRWGDDEVLYADVERGTAQGRAAYSKVTGALLQASKDNYRYLWIDTCCIDKSNNTELSEALNSMYAWYKVRILGPGGSQSDVLITYCLHLTRQLGSATPISLMSLSTMPISSLGTASGSNEDVCLWIEA